MLHPQAKALIELMIERRIPPMHTLPPAEARRVYLERRHITQPAPLEVGEVRALQATGPHGDIALRIYKPLRAAERQALPLLVYFHGGGWVIGDLDSHDTLCRELANGAGIAVVAVDYRMGPEHRFPVAVDDCVAATRWLHANAAALGLDAQRIAVAGDSAGGNLASVVAITMREQERSGSGRLPLLYQLLIYPATDQRRIADSHRRNGQGYLLTSDLIGYFHDHYIDDPAHDLDWRASPLLHPDLGGLPPALVLTAGFDPLRDEGLHYAQRLSEAGVAATHISFERQIHGFILMGRVIDEANVAVALCAAELRRHLHSR